MIKSLLIAAKNLLFTKVSNIFWKPETQANHSELFTVQKTLVLRIVARSFSDAIFSNFSVLRGGTKFFKRSFQEKISSKNSIIYILLKRKRIKRVS